MESLSVTIEMKATEAYFHMVLYIMIFCSLILTMAIFGSGRFKYISGYF